MIGGQRMRIWFALLCAVALAFSALGGGTATAAEMAPGERATLVQCIDAGTDEDSGCTLTGTHHHHASCSAHSVEAPPADIPATRFFAAPRSVGPGRDALLAGRGPPSLLRPPIA